MSDSSEGSSKRSAATQTLGNAGRGRKAAPDVAFELWLERGLHKMYDDIASEPIPAALLELIERDRKKTPGTA
ncbi:NepR family anti-sigma factor [Roseococcus pinisoli]|uniref:Anti-sigma factor NepR domain-containing protein n=1 Tax=Roseococcus pinisoli TaxID=2835040 RepID=A0ABS5Q9J5_9PROT|nr:hypothetical protein [Roseococcus pinisoli]